MQDRATKLSQILCVRSKNTVGSSGRQKNCKTKSKKRETGQKSAQNDEYRRPFFFDEKSSISTPIFSNVDCNSTARRPASKAIQVSQLACHQGTRLCKNAWICTVVPFASRVDRAIHYLLRRGLFLSLSVL